MALLIFLIIINAAAILALRAELRGRFEDETNTLLPALRRRTPTRR